MKTTIGCVGGGNIIRAILSGTDMSGNYKKSEIGVYDINADVVKDYANKGYVGYDTMEDAIKNSGIVILAVLPQVMRSIMPQVKSVYSPDNIFISLAAGISNDWFYENLGDDAKIVQCVPTLPAQVGLSAYSVSRSKAVTDSDYKAVSDFLNSSGIVVQVPDSLMYEVVPFAGAAPAYFYHMADIAMQEAEKFGLDSSAALKLFAQTMKGSAQMLLDAEITPKEMEKKLLLPGAATLAAINKMEELGFDDCIRQGIQACVVQCRNLGKL
jgi:Pyrroline-5-carboxylate reductase